MSEKITKEEFILNRIKSKLHALKKCIETDLDTVRAINSEYPKPIVKNASERKGFLCGIRLAKALINEELKELNSVIFTHIDFEDELEDRDLKKNDSRKE